MFNKWSNASWSEGQPPPVTFLQEGKHSASATAENGTNPLWVTVRFRSICLGDSLRSPEVLNWSAVGTANSLRMQLQNLTNHPRNLTGVFRLRTAAMPGVTNQTAAQTDQGGVEDANCLRLQIEGPCSGEGSN